MVDTRYTVDVFEELGRLASVYSGIDLYFDFGGWDEIVMKLNAMAKDRTVKRWPALFLFTPFDEHKGTETETESELSNDLLIATLTEKTLYSRERYDATIKPTLYPIYEGLLKGIEKSGMFYLKNGELIDHVMTIRDDLGKVNIPGGTGTLPEFIDAIKISNLKLTTRKNTCYGNNLK